MSSMLPIGVDTKYNPEVIIFFLLLSIWCLNYILCSLNQFNFIKKLLTFSILTYLFFTINSSAADQNSTQNIVENEGVLKIGVLLPLSGKFQDTGQSFLKAIQLALYDIGNENIKIYPKDSKANAIIFFGILSVLFVNEIKVILCISLSLSKLS